MSLSESHSDCPAYKNDLGLAKDADLQAPSRRMAERCTAVNAKASSVGPAAGLGESQKIVRSVNTILRTRATRLGPRCLRSSPRNIAAGHQEADDEALYYRRV